MKIRLEIRVTGRTVTELEFDAPVLHIGRDPACELALDPACEGVSWRHARIDMTPAGVFLHDIGSTNGTFVNDEQISGPTQLRAGDTFRLGQRGPQLVLIGQGSSAVRAPARLRPASPMQPASDPKPTLAGIMTPLRNMPTPSRRLGLRVFLITGLIAVTALVLVVVFFVRRT